jgi:glycosyltransferase involved in cell wall biosynthesis
MSGSDQRVPDPELQVFDSVTLVGLQKPNWGKHSGANSILNVLPANRFFLKRPVPGPIYRAWKPFRSWFYARNPYYEVNSAWLELKVAFDWFRKYNHIYHFLSGDNEFLFSGSLKRFPRKNRLVCTFHGVQSETMHFASYPKIQNLDAAVVVANNMVEFFQTLLGKDRVWCIPHGVDTTFWQPAETKSRNDAAQILFVGSHLRDFDVLHRVIQIVNERDPSIRFHAVVSKDHAAALQDLKCLTNYSLIDDLELRCLYQTSDVFLCPLLQCTASNSLLEALACGVPILVTDTGGVRDYVSEQSAFLTPAGDAEEMARALLSLIGDRQRLLEMSIASRKRALELDWMVVARQLAELYRSIL